MWLCRALIGWGLVLRDFQTLKARALNTFFFFSPSTRYLGQFLVISVILACLQTSLPLKTNSEPRRLQHYGALGKESKQPQDFPGCCLIPMGSDPPELQNTSEGGDWVSSGADFCSSSMELRAFLAAQTLDPLRKVFASPEFGWFEV